MAATPAGRAAAAARRAAAAAAAAAGADVPTLTDRWTLGGHTLPNRLVLAPLAGIGNWFVRLQAKRHGAGLVVSEMVSSFGLKHGNERTLREFLRIHPDEHPVSMQLFGHDADVMREAAEIVAERGRRHHRPEHGLPGAQGVQDRRRRRAAGRPRQGGRDRQGRGRGQRPAGHGQAAPGPASRRPRRRGAGPPPRGRGGRGGHRIPPPSRLAAAQGQARLRPGGRAGGGAGGAGDRLRRAAVRRAGRPRRSSAAAPRR